MKVIYDIGNVEKLTRPTAVSVGIFDGVHTGHKRILKELIRQGKKSKAISAVVTFNPHPDKVLKGESSVAMLAALNHRLSLIKDSGIKKCLVISFNRRIASYTAREFIKKILIDKLNMRILVVGEKFSFGRDMVRSQMALKDLAEELNFRLSIVKSKKYHKRTISSSLIRHMIEKGKLESAKRLLGRPVSILGTVVKGKRRGRIIGFRTANINPHHEAIAPSGVYAAYAKLEGRIYKSVLNIGTRPTFGESEPTVEVHMFGVDRDIYGKDIEIFFKKEIRPERKFKDKESLRRQIMKDAAYAKRIL